MEELKAHEKLVILAGISEHAGRYDDMRAYMKERVETGVPLGPEERDLLSVAYKGAVAARRAAMRVALAQEEHHKERKELNQAFLAEDFRARLEVEIKEVCGEFVKVLDAILPKAENGEPTTFYLKLKADYNRYMAELSASLSKEKAIKAAQAAYLEAWKEAEFHLLTTHPVRIGLALNHAVFQHEVLQDTEAAMGTAQLAYSAAIQALDGMPQGAWEDTEELLRDLKDNIATWQEELATKAELEAEAADAEAEE